MDVEHAAPLRRTLGATLLVTASVGVVALVVYLGYGLTGAALRSAFMVVAAGLMFVVVRVARRFDIVGHVLALLYAVVVVSAVSERGPATLLLPTLAILPLLAMFTGGRRAGWLWSGIAVVIAIGAFMIEPTPVLNAGIIAFAEGIIAIGLIGAVAMLGSSFARSQQQARSHLAEANEQLAARNRLLSKAISDAERSEAAAEVARNQAQAASHAKSVFLTAMSHEVRTPLNGIVGLAALLSEADLSPDDAELVAHIRQSGEVLAELLGDVLDLSALEAGEVPLREAAFDPRAPLRQVIAGFAPLARERGVVLALDVAGDVPTVLGDASRVRQVVSHLVGNALKYTAEGRVLVRLRSSRTPDGNAQLRSLAVAMGGELNVRTEPGEGSVFVLRLDLPEVTLVPEDTLPLLSPGLRVAVIEDEPVNRKVLQTMLEKAGCIVEVAVDGAQGLELIRRTVPALVLSDVQMPNLDGVEMTRALRTEGIQIPIVAVTANALSADRIACLEAGMNDVLTKPVHPMSLLTTVSRWTASAEFSDSTLRRLAGASRDAS